MWKAPEIDVAKGGGDVSKGEHDVDSTGDRCGCSRIFMGTVMEGDVKAAGGFPLEAEDDVAAVEKDVGAAVSGPNPQGDSIRESEEIFTAKSAKEDFGFKAKRRERGERGGRRGEFDCLALLASWRFIFFPSVAMI